MKRRVNLQMTVNNTVSERRWEKESTRKGGDKKDEVKREG